MAEKKNSNQTQQPTKNQNRKPRKHGYRGYGSGHPKGARVGSVHIGRGFAGVEPLGAGAAATLPEAGLFTENLKEQTSKPSKPSKP